MHILFIFMLPGSELMRNSFFTIAPKDDVFAVVGQVQLYVQIVSVPDQEMKWTKGRREASVTISDGQYKSLSTVLCFYWEMGILTSCLNE
jgi:hypothetical protein